MGVNPVVQPCRVIRALAPGVGRAAGGALRPAGWNALAPAARNAVPGSPTPTSFPERGVEVPVEAGLLVQGVLEPLLKVHLPLDRVPFHDLPGVAVGDPGLPRTHTT